MKVKNIIALTGILLFFTSSVVVLHKVSSAFQKKEEQYANIPAFHLPDLNGKVVSDTTIDRSKATLFYFFDPECNLCLATFDDLKIRYSEFSGNQILLIALISEEKVREFLNEIDFSPPENIKILLDENAELVSLMDVKGIPSSFIYKEAALIKRFDGPVKTETLINYLQ
jgi:peroxiredoxin